MGGPGRFAWPGRCGAPPAGGTCGCTRGPAQPWPRYHRAELRAWQQRLSAEWSGERDVYVYFNNDPGGAAIHDAVAFGQIARAAGHDVTRTPGVVPPPADG